MHTQTSETDDLLFQRIEQRDHFEHSLCDTTDFKASVIVLLITFLVGLAASLLGEKDLHPVVRSGQAIVLLLSACSLLFSVFCLAPRVYSTEKLPHEYEGWLERLRAHFASRDNADSRVLATFKQGLADKALERVKSNYAVNRTKLGYLYASFWLFVAALGFELFLLCLASFKLLA